MDLGAVKDRLDGGILYSGCHGRASFERDVSLVFSNAVSASHPSTLIHKEGVRLQLAASKMLAGLTQQHFAPLPSLYDDEGGVPRDGNRKGGRCRVEEGADSVVVSVMDRLLGKVVTDVDRADRARQLQMRRTERQQDKEKQRESAAAARQFDVVTGVMDRLLRRIETDVERPHRTALAKAPRDGIQCLRQRGVTT
jgi:hypothetical protein